MAKKSYGLRPDEREPGRRVRLTGRFLRSTGQVTGDEGGKRWTIRECNCDLCVQLPWSVTRPGSLVTSCPHGGGARTVIVVGRLAMPERPSALSPGKVIAATPAYPDRTVSLCEACYQAARADFVCTDEPHSDTSTGYEDIAPEHRPRWRHVGAANLETCDGRGKPKAGDYP
jgi:hypothetical protein